MWTKYAQSNKSLTKFTINKLSYTILKVYMSEIEYNLFINHMSRNVKL